MPHLDPHQRPPDSIRNVYKKYQRFKLRDLNQDDQLIDLTDIVPSALSDKVRIIDYLSHNDLERTFQSFASGSMACLDSDKQIPIFEHVDMPGLHIIPSLLPPETQQILLSHLLHRDLSNPAHLTNIHTHYQLAYPPSNHSFFTIPPSCKDSIATPLDSTIHKHLTISQLLNKKMRWTTLGGQYDWTAKQYPNTPPPPFPPDIKGLLEGIFKDTRAEAAIVNLYSPGDTLSVHRDVAESSTTGLVSISLGCDAVFVIGTTERAAQSEEEGQAQGQEQETDCVLALRLRSGSAVYMSGASRFAWHGVPQIVAGTCPEYLKDWPADASDDTFEEWKGWMENKRVNLNVRQMWD